MPHFSFGALGPVLDLRQQLRFTPNASMRDALRVGLCLAHQRVEFVLKLLRVGWRKAVINFARVDQVLALAATKVEAIPFLWLIR